MNDAINIARYFKKRSDSTFSKTVLLKYIYCSELKYIALHHKRLTKLKYLHYDHGPYTSDINSIDEISDNFEEITFNFLKEKLGADVIKVLDLIIEKWSGVPYDYDGQGGMSNYVYHTLPFILTPFNEKIPLEDYLDLDNIDRITIKKKRFKQFEEAASDSSEIMKFLHTKKGKAALSNYLETHEA